MTLLDGITIIDFTRLLPGPVATHLLAQMGAKIIKIESPKRMDYARAQPGQVDGASILFHQLNHNKEQLLIDYETVEGKAQIRALVKKADVIIEQFRPGAMAAWGLSYADLKAINPNLVYVSLTGYGQEGVLASEAGHDFNYLAYTGLMSLFKDENGKPTVPDTQLADISGAYMAVMATQAALLQRFRTGEGSFVDVSLAASVLPFLTIPYGLQAIGLDYRQLNVINGKLAANYAAYECADGKWLSVGALELKFWNKLCDAVEKVDWKRSNQLELLNTVFPKQEVETLFKSKNQAHWVALFKGKDVCVAPILELEELEKQTYHGTSFESFKTSKGTTLKTIALPFKAKK